MFLQRHIPRVCCKKHKPTAQTNAADHLNTPRHIADDTNKTAWQWPYSAFGDNKPTGILKASTSPTNAVTQDQTTNAQLKAAAPAFKFNLRFAGQYADEESNLNYNYFRNYQPNQGRYSQNDPIGLAGGWNMKGYVGGNPLSRIDPLGLEFIVAGRGTANLYSDGGGLLTSYPYTSGVGGSSDPSARNQGPLPPGRYTFDPSEISEGGFVRDLLGDWGKYRVPLKPTTGTNTFGRDGFFLHGGKKPGSKGCIDLGSGDEDFFSRVRNIKRPVDVFMGPQ